MSTKRRESAKRLKNADGVTVCSCDSEAVYKAWCQERQEVSRLADRLISSHRWNMEWQDGRWVFANKNDDFYDWKAHRSFREYLLEKYAPAGAWTAGRKTAWDADHIQEVVNGGGLCGLENYQTLCHPCHKAKTARLARERAEVRRAQQKKPLTHTGGLV